MCLSSTALKQSERKYFNVSLTDYLHRLILTIFSRMFQSFKISNFNMNDLVIVIDVPYISFDWLWTFYTYHKIDKFQTMVIFFVAFSIYNDWAHVDLHLPLEHSYRLKRRIHKENQFRILRKLCTTKLHVEYDPNKDGVDQKRPQLMKINMLISDFFYQSSSITDGNSRTVEIAVEKSKVRILTRLYFSRETRKEYIWTKRVECR